MFTCGAGCGEMYWGEWHYDPPEACDPCNNHGDYVGPRPCPPPLWHRFWQGVHGARYGGAACAGTCGPECDATCGVEPGCGIDAGMPLEGEIIDGTWQGGPEMWEESLPPAENIPTPAATPEEASREASLQGARPYYNRHPKSRLVRRQ